MRARRIRTACLLGLLVVLGRPVRAAEPASPGARDALAQLQDLVGKWRGVGMPKRGSAAGAWKESIEWAWSFADGDTALVIRGPEARYLQHAQLRSQEEPGHYALSVIRSDERTVVYRGKFEDARLKLLAGEPLPSLPARITLRFVADGDRLIVLYEQRRPGSKRYFRLAEVGYTRVGSDFAQGQSYPECVVTGGRGTIALMHDGKTYYVCCSGCRDLFEDDPAGVLAEYRARLAAARDKRSDTP